MMELSDSSPKTKRRGVIVMAKVNNMRVRLVAIALSALLVVVGVMLWRYYLRPPQEVSEQEDDSKHMKQSHVGKRLSVEPDSTRQDIPSAKPMESETNTQDERKQMENALAWLDSLTDDGDQMDNLENSETADPKEEWLLRRFGMTRAEIRARIPVFEQEIRTEVTRIVSLHDEYVGVLQSMDPLAGDRITPGSELDKWCREADAEIRRAWRDVKQNKIPLYIQYRVQTDDSPDDLMSDSLVGHNGWLYEMQRGRPKLGIPSPLRFVSP